MQFLCIGSCIFSQFTYLILYFYQYGLIFISMDLWIFIYFVLYIIIHYDIIFLFKLFLLGSSFSWFCMSLWHTPTNVFCFTFWASLFYGTTKCSRSSCAFLVPESAIYSAFWLQNYNKNQVLAARYAPCYQDVLAFGLSQLPKQRNICVCILVHVPRNISILIFCIYIKLNINLIKCFQFQSINTWIIQPSFICFSLYIYFLNFCILAFLMKLKL